MLLSQKPSLLSMEIKTNKQDELRTIDLNSDVETESINSKSENANYLSYL
jgi:hypothetical protein